MKKIVIIFFLIATIISATVFGIKILNKSDADFPHYRQACLKYNGTAYGFANKNFEISFHFLDESVISELSDSSNIVEMKVIDDKNRMLPVNITKLSCRELELSYTKNDYYLRNIYTTVVFDEIGEYVIKEVQIKYIDDSVEKYDVGELNIIVEDENRNASEYIYFRNQRVVTSQQSDKKYCNFSKILFCFSSFNSGKPDKITVTDINLGINDIEIDFGNIEILNKYSDDDLLNYYYQNRKPINIVDKLEDKIVPFDISFDSGDAKTLVIPISSIDKEKEPQIYVITPMLTYEANGNTYTVRSNKSNFITPLVSIDKDKGGMNVEQYIKEFGI